MSEELYCDISSNITKRTYFKAENQKEIEIENIDINELFTISTPR
jgi:hypothetical protein